MQKKKNRTAQQQTVQALDASGRGKVGEFKVPFPARMHGYTEEAIQAVVQIMRNAEAQTQGQYMRQFEADFKAYTGAEHTFAVNSASSALRLAAILCRLKPNDEVIIPAYTFCASAIPFGMSGVKIVWADINRQTWVVDPADIEQKITAKTKALVVVHLLGMPANMPLIMSIAKNHNLRVVEDCSQAPGAAINGQKVGTFGDFGCFSFQGAKNITTLGEGGFLAVRSDEDAKLVPGLRHNGCRAYEGQRKQYWVPAMGNVDLDIEGVWPHKFCLGEAQCAVGIAELKSLESVTETLISQARKIIEILADTPEISFAKVPKSYRHIYHQCVLHFDGSAFGATRNDLMDILVNEYKIRCIVQYYPLYRYPLFQKMGSGQHHCPVLEEWWDNSFSFPWWAGIADETIDYLTSSLKAAIATLKK